VENTDNIEKLKERVSKDPTSKLFLPLAEEYRKAGMHDEAIEVLKTGIEHQPGYMSARVALGKIYLEKDMKLEAREEFEKVAKAIPDNLFAQRKLADIYREVGQREKAIEQYSTVLALNPMDEEAQLHLKQLKEAGQEGKAPLSETEKEEEALLEEFEPGEAAYEEGGAAHEEPAGQGGIGGEEVEQVSIESTLEALSRAEERTGEEPQPEGAEPEGEEEELEMEETWEEPAAGAQDEAGAIFAGEEDMREERVPDLAEADSFIAEGDYRRAMSAYKAMLSRRPEDRIVLQRVEELRALLKLLGKDKELLEANIEAFLEGIKKKKDEFFRGP
jgi:tetratricopeptide (TPR) repeat protein